VGGRCRGWRRDVVAEPLTLQRHGRSEAREKAGAADAACLKKSPERWASRHRRSRGADQQRVNIARGVIYDLPILLLDEPKAHLDAANRAVRWSNLERTERKRKGCVSLVAIVQ